MGDRLKKILRFSNLVRIGTIILIASFLIAYATPFIHPKNIWILPFFGLAYPILLFIAVITFIYWLLLRSVKWSIAVFLTVAIGYPYIFLLFAYGEVNELPANEKTSITILSNNVQIFDLYDENREKKYETRDSIFSYAISQNPDVVCFQEFYQKDEPTTFQTTNLFREKFSAVDHHQRYIYKKIGRQHFGVALFSRLPIIAKGDVIFEVEDETNYNFCIYADVIKNEDTFRVYNVHLQSFRISKIEDDITKKDQLKGLVKKLKTAYPKRANQAIRVNEHIRNSPYPVIVCGDFNDTPISFVHNQFQNHLTDAFLNCGSGIGSTYVGKVPAGRIDYIFHSPELISTNFVIQKRPFSDHRTISCTVSKTN
jgi:endonuclease/exonuclease/phosphatase family metal-dependent hydrolase